MTKAVIQPLESYRLVQYAMPIQCYICEADNTCDAEYCHVCSAPMALAHQAAAQKVEPRMVAVLGASGVGKTVYLGMLMDMLSRHPKLQVLARGAFSISLQQAALAALSQCEFPRKTPNEPDRWNWVHCQIRQPSRRSTLEMIVPDMAGEALLEEVDHPHTYRVIKRFLQHCIGSMVLVDAAQVRQGRREQDFFSMKLLSYLNELKIDNQPSWAERPLALVFTKADHCEECQEDPNEYARVHMTGLWQQCQERFPCHRFFSVSVAGSCVSYDSLTEGRVYIPLRIEPHGIVEPFLWMLDELNKRIKDK